MFRAGSKSFHGFPFTRTLCVFRFPGTLRRAFTVGPEGPTQKNANPSSTYVYGMCHAFHDCGTTMPSPSKKSLYTSIALSPKLGTHVRLRLATLCSMSGAIIPS